MVVILISALVLISVFAGIGAFTERLLHTEKSNISFTVLKGMTVITLLWTLLSFFVPLNSFLEGFTVALGIAFFFWLKIYLIFLNFVKENPIFIGLAVIVSFFGSFHPYILDHFGYYVPTVKWLSEFGIIKGISNLDLILGQMSFWHVLQAGFSHFTDSFLRLNSVFLLIYLIYIFEKKSWLHLAFLPLLFLFSQQPSPDLPVFVFSLIILNEFLDGNKNFGFLLTLSVFVFAIKPTAVWLPLLFLLSWSSFTKKDFRQLIPAALLLLLFFFKNIWTFGYPVFPVQLADFGFNWKPNAELLQNSSKLAVEKTFDLQYSFDQIKNFSIDEYLINWLTLSGIKGIINSLFLLSLLAMIIFSIIKRNRKIWIISIALFIKSVAVLLFSAQYRFFLDVFFAVAFVLLYQNFSKIKSWTTFSVLTAVVVTFFLFPKVIQTQIPSFSLGFALGKFEWKQLMKPAVYEYSKYSSYQIGNLKFNAVKDYPFSFETPLPAISPGFILEYYHAGIFPQLKSTQLKDGFVWKKLSDNEKSEVKKILIELNINPETNYYSTQR